MGTNRKERKRGKRTRTHGEGQKTGNEVACLPPQYEHLVCDLVIDVVQSQHEGAVVECLGTNDRLGPYELTLHSP